MPAAKIFATAVMLTGAACYDVAFEDVTVGGMICGSQNGARVYYPVAQPGGPSPGQVPIISFAHGFTACGPAAYNQYSDLLAGVAKEGYAVIAFEAGHCWFECPKMYQDQCRSVAHLRSSVDFASRVDPTAKAGVMGHSMGGGASYASAGHGSFVEEHKIGAAVAFNPQIQRPIPLVPIQNPFVPILFVTGTQDSLVSAASVRSAYSSATGVPRIFANIDGSDHNEPVNGNPNRLVEYAVAMFDCHLKDNVTQCGKVYGARGDSLCGGALRMAECIHADEPQYESSTVVV